METTFEVKIRLKSVIKHTDMGPETTVLHTKGVLYIKGGAYFLRYKEEMEGVGSVDHTVKIKGDEALILRTGAVSMRQPLKVGEALTGSYNSPYGQMETVTTLNRCEAGWQDKSRNGRLLISYDLVLQGQAVGRFTLTFKLEEVQ
ncbi:hypothetical protein GCM10011391_04100 [Pullulanibacillus camelliae]|uniref:DUF1934 domain-containing protein n=1 Tax=Pullulanibacillus camelliae TaxID=1707096 RepID=A0A8J2YFD7_9BACL|nr:DUF1934 domain-containing protein [Pullulanibacillus camelliae]GGE28706.1 hypothetical protein GCM10011391_04100 [Pullulanibacillus camelliae]